MQKRKNIKLLIILVLVTLMTVLTYFLLNKEDSQKLNNADTFAVVDVSQIDSVAISGNIEPITLHYDEKSNDWYVNEIYPADPQKLTVLFAILNQVRARRPVARAEQEKVDSLFNSTGVHVRFYEGDQIVKEFESAGLREKGITYFRNDEGTFLVNIPGYRSYLAAIFSMNISGWRNKLIFHDISWTNLESVIIDLPSEEAGFTIEPDKGFYSIDGITSTDSVKLLDYLDRVSLLTADEFIEVPQKRKAPDNPVMKMTIKDIRNRPFTLKVFPGRNATQFLALRDSGQWLLINKAKIQPLIKKEEFFIRK